MRLMSNILSYKLFKRLSDIGLAAFLFVIFSPFFIFTSLVLFFHLGLPLFFVQERIGFQARTLRVVKLRTLPSFSESPTLITSVIRKYGLDELPQLLLILTGKMSFVGPRPLLPSYLPLYTQRQSLRHHVLPGLTGLAQLYSHQTPTWSSRFRLDVLYVYNQSFILDLRIILSTLPQLLMRTGKPVSPLTSSVTLP